MDLSLYSIDQLNSCKARHHRMILRIRSHFAKVKRRALQSMTILNDLLKRYTLNFLGEHMTA